MGTVTLRNDKYTLLHMQNISAFAFKTKLSHIDIRITVSWELDTSLLEGTCTCRHLDLFAPPTSCEYCQQNCNRLNIKTGSIGLVGKQYSRTS